MTGSSGKSKSKAQEVEVVVVVNHGDLRRNERGTVELTDHIKGLLDKGYLRLADDDETEPTAARLGETAARGREPRAVLLGVEGIPGSVPVGTGGETAAD